MKNIALGILVLVAVGVGVGYSADFFQRNGAALNDIESAAGENEDTAVLARIGEETITRSELEAQMDSLPQQFQNASFEQIFPLLLQQAIASKVIEMQADQEVSENEPEVQEQLAKAKSNIVRNVYLEQYVDDRLTDDRIQEAYDDFKEAQPEQTEIAARHILVEDEAKAKDLLKQLKNGADFAELAQEHSTGPTGENGGDLGYFIEGEMVKEFSDAAFAKEDTGLLDAPVKTQFGWHVVEVTDRRTREVPPIAEVRPFIEQQLRQQIISEHISELRALYNVEMFGLDGQPFGQDMGQEDAAAQPNSAVEAPADTTEQPAAE